MHEKHSAYTTDDLIRKYGNGGNGKKTGFEFTGGQKAWTVQLDGQTPTGHLATPPEIISGDIRASLVHGKPSRIFGTRDQELNQARIQGAGEIISHFPIGAKASKSLVGGSVRIVPSYPRK